MNDYLILFGIVLGINLMPAFGPPTWSVIVIYGLDTKIPIAALVAIGAVAAALGRFLLAHLFRLIRNHISDRTKRNIAAARATLEGKKRNAIIAICLFALSPIPSAQLFEAAGLSGVPLVGFTAAFFVGRTLSYSIYAVTADRIAQSTIGGSFKDALTSPIGISIQLIMIALLVAITQIDWEKRLGGGHARVD